MARKVTLKTRQKNGRKTVGKSVTLDTNSRAPAMQNGEGPGAQRGRSKANQKKYCGGLWNYGIIDFSNEVRLLRWKGTTTTSQLTLSQAGVRSDSERPMTLQPKSVQATSNVIKGPAPIYHIAPRQLLILPTSRHSRFVYLRHDHGTATTCCLHHLGRARGVDDGELLRNSA